MSTSARWAGLFYTEEEFAHRFIYVPEYSAIKEDPEIVGVLRVLLSENRIRQGPSRARGRSSRGRSRRRVRPACS